MIVGGDQVRSQTRPVAVEVDLGVGDVVLGGRVASQVPSRTAVTIAW